MLFRKTIPPISPLRLTKYLLALLVLPVGCVDSFDPKFTSTVNVVVVDGTITNLPEPQVIRLNRSQADPVTGRFGTAPITDATVQVVVDSSEVINAHETIAGTYRLPSDFRGQVGHSYQLRLTLPDGTRYLSTSQVMPAVPPIEKVQAQFTTQAPRPNDPTGLMSAHEFYLDTKDPAEEHNYYLWDWRVYERQEWCRSCEQGVYAVNNIIPKKYFHNMFVSGEELFEDCFIPPPPDPNDWQAPSVDRTYWVYDYRCRTRCWEIIHNYNLNLFDDALTNGGPIRGRKVATIPYYQRIGCLVVIRQLGLTKDAYQFYKIVETQSQNSGGLADTPPSAPVGNVKNVANERENVVGFFTASAVSEVRHWLDRKDATGLPIAAYDEKGNPLHAHEELYFALYNRRPYPEPYPPYTGEREAVKIQIWGGPPRVPTAVCVPSDSRTPQIPLGWPDE
ncbi:DUF4249 domain-containing protein [Telluribacter sp.]|jgi:hypothetical protein|uniref:DUF4249 domain-containing protein n=1 Tax=Telluribacter sp. TaxID=1978767 RepID=UPI002E0D84E1|nr:DUF4249 domain-containing protein [Telluribacter sp.]